MVNQLLVEGYLLDDPSHRVFENSTLAKFTIKVPVPKRNSVGELLWDMNFFDVDMWNPQEGSMVFDVKKGDRVVLDGKLVQERWERDGKKNSKIKIIAKEMFRDL